METKSRRQFNTLLTGLRENNELAMTDVGEVDSKRLVNRWYGGLKEEWVKDNWYFNPEATGVLRTPTESKQRKSKDPRRDRKNRYFGPILFGP